MKKIILRKCVATNAMISRDNLLRVVKTKDNQILIDLDNKIAGRGAYVTKSEEAINIARKKKAFEKAFQISFDPSLYDSLLQMIKKER